MCLKIYNACEDLVGVKIWNMPLCARSLFSCREERNAHTASTYDEVGAYARYVRVMSGVRTLCAHAVGWPLCVLRKVVVRDKE